MAPALSSEPVRLTVPRVRVKVPRPAVAKAPPRVTVASVAVMVPWFAQGPVPEPSASVEPVAVMVPTAAFVHDPPSVIPPAPAEMAPRFSKASGLMEIVPGPSPTIVPSLTTRIGKVVEPSIAPWLPRIVIPGPIEKVCAVELPWARRLLSGWLPTTISPVPASVWVPPWK